MMTLIKENLIMKIMKLTLDKKIKKSKKNF